MQKLFMDCLFSAELKGKDAFTVFCISHTQCTGTLHIEFQGLVFELEVLQLGWVWGRSIIEISRKTGISLPLNCGCFPPEQQTGAVRMRPTAPTAMGAALCQARGWAELNFQQGSVGLQQNQHYIAIGSQKSHLTNPSSQTSGEVWTCLGLSGDQTGGSVAGFSYSLALCNCMV